MSGLSSPDRAGVFVFPRSRMRLEMGPCRLGENDRLLGARLAACRAIKCPLDVAGRQMDEAQRPPPAPAAEIGDKTTLHLLVFSRDVFLLSRDIGFTGGATLSAAIPLAKAVGLVVPSSTLSVWDG